MQKGYLLLEDGTTIEGESFGYQKSVSGEVVFSTAMVGYPESLTDPSYFGQILVFTYPLIGNYGVPKPKMLDRQLFANFESHRIWVSGLIVANYIDTPSHYSCHHTLAAWLKKYKIPALTGIDTRMLTKKLREKGVMKGQIIFDRRKKLDFIDINQTNLVASVSIREPILYHPAKRIYKRPILLFDCGVKHGIIRELLKRNLSVLRVPWDYKIENLAEFSGVVISNGPGDPLQVESTIVEIRKLLRENIPIFGICLGNQILALAAGGKTYKLKYGHRSCNQPVKDSFTGRCFITTQNHGYAVDGSSLPRQWQEWLINLNDGTNEGIRHKEKPWFTIQFHAEANPGPEDTKFFFDEFAQAVKKYESLRSLH